MKKSLLPLAIVAAVLVVLVVIKNSRKEQVSIVDQANLTALSPADLTPADVGKIELYTGADPETKVVLGRSEASPEEWVLTSHYGAPVADEKIETFLEDITSLKGEYRSTASDDEDLKSYELTEEEALHLLAYEKGSDTAAFHVLLGKSPNFRSIFIRPEGGMEVYVESKNLKNEAGLSGQDATLEATPWLDKEILALAQEDIEGLTLDMPSKHLVFNKEVVETASGEAAADAGGEEGGEEALDSADPAPAPESKWVLAEGGPGSDFKQTGLDNLLRKFTNLTANDVADPSKKAEYGLEPPMFTAAIDVAGQEEPVVLQGGRKDASGSGYLTVASSGKDIVYEVAKWNFDSLFPKGGDLFELTGVEVDGEIDRIELTQDGQRIVVAKEGEEWSVVEPAANLPIQKTAISSMASALSNWSPADYVNSAEGTGLDSPAATVTFSAGGASSHTIHVGNEAEAFDGRYVRVEGRDDILAMSRSDVTRILKAPKDLFQLALVSDPAQSIQSFTVQEGDRSMTLSREGAAWALQVNGEAASQPVDAGAAEELLETFAGLQANGIVFGQTSLEGEPVATVTATLNDGSPITIQFAALAEDGYPAFVTGIEQVVTIAAPDYDALTPEADSLTTTEEEAAAQAAEEAAASEEEAAQQGGSDTPAQVVTPLAPQNGGGNGSSPGITITPAQPTQPAAPEGNN